MSENERSEELARLRAEVEDLRAQNAALRAEKLPFREPSEMLNIGRWQLIRLDGAPDQLYGDKTMDALVGCDSSQVTPEAYCKFLFDRAHPDHHAEMAKVVEAIKSGRSAEIHYPYQHPTRGEIWVRGGGRRDPSFTGGMRVIGYQQDITDLIHVQKLGLDVMTALCRDFHTIWLIDKRTQRMSLLRAVGKDSLAQQVLDAFQAGPMGYDEALVWYLNRFVVPEDQVRLLPELTYARIVQTCADGDLHDFPFLRAVDGGRSIHYVVAYADAGDSLVMAFRNVDDMVRRKEAAARTAQELLSERDLFDKEQRINASLEALVEESDMMRLLDRVLAMWGEALGAQHCHLCRWNEGGSLTIVRVYAAPGEPRLFENNAEVRRSQQFDHDIHYHGGSDYVGLVDFDQRGPLQESLACQSAHPDAVRALASFHSHLVRFEGKLWGSLSLIFKDRRAFTENEKSFFEAAANVVRLMLVRHRFQNALTRQNRQLVEERDRVLAAEKARSLFFSTVSHDIRTPLNSIIGFSELLEKGVSDAAEHARYVGAIRASGKVLSRLVNDILDLAKLSSGKLVLLKEPTDVPALMTEVAEAFQVVRAQKPIVFTQEAAEMPRVNLDPQRIRQFLYNLLSNAFKYTDRGRILLKSTWCDGTLTLAVTDTGRGISQANIARILQPFVQVADRNHRDGTGLGLSICQQLAQLMGGTLDVTSEVGKGSTFSVVLPGVEVVSAPAASHGEEPSSPVAAPPAGVCARRVLIVDDSAVNVMVLKAMLTRCGVAEVLTAENGRVAWDLLRAGTACDLVLSDYWMPEMDGCALVQAIRADAAHAQLPVYLVTADVEARKTYSQMGFTGLLLKPITYQSVAALLARG